MGTFVGAGILALFVFTVFGMNWLYTYIVNEMDDPPRWKRFMVGIILFAVFAWGFWGITYLENLSTTHAYESGYEDAMIEIGYK